MKNYICRTCGIQYAASRRPPAECIICRDERQYVGWNGQQWTTLGEMVRGNYRNEIRKIEPGLYGIGTEPRFAIGQRSLLVVTKHGNILWDPISYLDRECVEQIHKRGGIQAISASHPHFYAAMVEWSRAFEKAPIYLPQADNKWVMRPDPAIKFFRHCHEILPGATIMQCGGHFEGSSVLHWAHGSEGRGALLAGDTIMVAMDRKSASFMYSYPNLIPLSPDKVREIVRRIRPYAFDRLYSAWWDRDIAGEAKRAVFRSVDRYLKMVSEKGLYEGKDGTLEDLEADMTAEDLQACITAVLDSRDAPDLCCCYLIDANDQYADPCHLPVEDRCCF